MPNNTEISVKEIFDLFVKNFGHNVLNRRQEEWSSADEGWDKNALLHMLYWLNRDTEGLTHGGAWAAATSKEPDLLKNLIADLFKLAADSKK